MADPTIIMKAIGPSFESEWRAAGLSGNGFSWASDRVLIMPDISSSDMRNLKKVIANHDSTLPAPPVQGVDYSRRVSKVAFFRRCTESEAMQFISDLSDTSPKLKAIFDAVTYLVPGTDEYPLLRTAVEDRVGVSRADVLLAPSND